MYVRLLMKGSISFDPNNAKFTQKLNARMENVINYIQPKMVLNWLKIANMLSHYEIMHKMLEMWQDLSAAFSCAEPLKGSY